MLINLIFTALLLAPYLLWAIYFKQSTASIVNEYGSQIANIDYSALIPIVALILTYVAMYFALKLPKKPSRIEQLEEEVARLKGEK